MHIFSLKVVTQFEFVTCAYEFSQIPEMFIPICFSAVNGKEIY